MIKVSDDKFEELLVQAIDNIPDKYAKRMDNVGIFWENEPTEEQRKNLKLHCNQTLFGLYEGIPLTKRGAGYNLVLPDKITLFKLPLESAADSIDDLRDKIGRTLWHEVAHYFGLDHNRIHSLERNERTSGQ
jgi:predicted Zn-dependent protease with MMP-like domain